MNNSNMNPGMGSIVNSSNGREQEVNDSGSVVMSS